MTKRTFTNGLKSFFASRVRPQLIFTILAIIGFLFFGSSETLVTQERAGEKALGISYWAKTYEIDYVQGFDSIEQTTDGGFIALGYAADLGYVHTYD